MVRELLILRHGRAGDASRDIARPLTAIGERDIERVGAWIANASCVPDATVSSPATRAHRTAVLCLEACGANPTLVHVDERIYDAGTQTLLDVLAAASGGRVMLVGHNPGLSELASVLASARIGLSPGSLVRLQLPADWTSLDPGSAAILDRVDASDLMVP